MEETSKYIFEKIDENIFESWRVVHNKKGGYSKNDVLIKIGTGSGNDTFIYISDDDSSVYIAKEQVKWLRDILNEIDLGDE